MFRRTLGFAERSLVSELRDVRNKWAHQSPFSSDDTDRAIVLRPRPAMIVDADGGNVGVPEPRLHVGDVGLLKVVSAPIFPRKARHAIQLG